MVGMLVHSVWACPAKNYNTQIRLQNMLNYPNYNLQRNYSHLPPKTTIAKLPYFKFKNPFNIPFVFQNGVLKVLNESSPTLLTPFFVDNPWHGLCPNLNCFYPEHGSYGTPKWQRYPVFHLKRPKLPLFDFSNCFWELIKRLDLFLVRFSGLLFLVLTVEVRLRCELFVCCLFQLNRFFVCLYEHQLDTLKYRVTK